jgi:hypothetical protein
MESNQWKVEYSDADRLSGMIWGGKAASPRIMLANKGSWYEAKREIEMITGKMAGYSTGAGSNAAGICMRWRKRRLEVARFLHEKMSSLRGYRHNVPTMTMA